MANQVFDPNWLQRMFTPEGYGYQWQNRPDQGGGEFTGYIPDVYEGDAQDLRMVPKAPIAATQRDHDFYGGQPGEMSPMSPPVASAPAAVHGGEPDLPASWSPFDYASQAALVRPGITTEQLKSAGRRVPIIGKRIFPSGGSVTGAGSVPSSGTRPAGVVSPGRTTPTVYPRTMGAKIGPNFNAALEAQRTHASGGKGSTTVGGRRYTGTHPLNTGNQPLDSEVETRKLLERIEENRAARATAEAERRAGRSIPRAAPVKDVPAGTSRASGGSGSGGAASAKFGWGTDIPEYLKNLGHTKTAALLRTLGPLAWATTLTDAATAGLGAPAWLPGWLGGGRTGVVNHAWGGDELIEENARRALQGLPPIVGQGAGEGGMQDPTEYFLDFRNYGNNNFVNPLTYWRDKFSDMFTPSNQIPSGIEGQIAKRNEEAQVRIDRENMLRSKGVPEYLIEQGMGRYYRGPGSVGAL